MSDTNLDPEIAELLGIVEERETISEPQFSTDGKPIKKTHMGDIDLKKVFNDQSSYEKIISEAGEYGQRFHDILINFTRVQEKDEKSMFREKLVPAYWNMLTALIDDFFDKPTDAKQALFRYGLLKPSYITDKQKQLLLSINGQKNSAEDFHYLDEWLLLVGNGKIKLSSVDETVKAKKKSSTFFQEKLERKIGARDAELASVRQKIEHHLMIERSLQSSTAIILDHRKLPEYGNIIAPYSIEQKKALTQLQEIIRNLIKSDKSIDTSFRTLKSLEQDIRELKSKTGEVVEEISTKTVREEFQTLRQMIKLTVGRQGNHFPFLLKTYMPRNLMDIGSKDNLLQMLEEFERIDPGVFIRRYKQEEHRIIPHFILVPSYGDYGVCWEPFERNNRATSKGRVAIPIFSRDLKTAVLYGLGDLRWQVAKEKALHRWMEEGITGYYYDYVQKNRIKGDLKELFIQDYILWIKFESQGLQKLHKDVRAIFWRYIPFPNKLKELLKNRGYYYAELYRKDQNRAISRGY